jgi:uncharacterized protein YuzB (UPF0349 family)
MKIRLCEHNQGVEKLAKQLEGQFTGLNIKIKKCAKQCKVCKREPFAVADGQLIKASDSVQLLFFLKQLIEQNNYIAR